MKSAMLASAVLAAVLLCSAPRSFAQYIVEPAPGAAISQIEQCKTDTITKQIKCEPISPVAAVTNPCPIAMEARQGGGLRMERAGKDDATSSRPFMVPSLTLKNQKDKRIVSATVTAHGFGANKGTTLLDTKSSSDGVILRGDANQPRRPRLSRTLTVKFQPDGDNAVSADILLPGFVVLDSIALNAVTYADGTIWDEPAPNACHVRPNPLMLVAGK